MEIRPIKHCPNPDCPGLARDGVGAEFVAPLEVCLDCGTRLVSGPYVAPEAPVLEYVDLRTVFIASGLAQGQIVAAAIEAEGIPVYVKGESLQGALGELPVDVARVEVQVPLERVEEAREIALWYEGEGAF